MKPMSNKVQLSAINKKLCKMRWIEIVERGIWNTHVDLMFTWPNSKI